MTMYTRAPQRENITRLVCSEIRTYSSVDVCQGRMQITLLLLPVGCVNQRFGLYIQRVSGAITSADVTGLAVRLAGVAAAAGYGGGALRCGRFGPRRRFGRTRRLLLLLRGRCRAAASADRQLRAQLLHQVANCTTKTTHNFRETNLEPATPRHYTHCCSRERL